MRLPLPVARLHRRSFNAKSAKDRHDAAWYAWEVSVRVGVAAAPPANAATLARASVGQWCAALRPKDRPIDDAAILALVATLTEVASGTRSERRSVTPRDVLDALPAYRNKVLGHGSTRPASFYEDAGRVLLAGLEAAWRENVFLPRDAILAHVDAVSLDASGGRVARALDLSSEAPVVIDGGSTRVPDTVLPRRLYLRAGSEWRALHPWLLFEEEDERLWCFNGLSRRADFLDYASGETLSGTELERAFAGTEAAVRALLGAGEAQVEGTREAAPTDDRHFGDYEVVGKLGEGGMGEVYLARQTSLDRTVALKMLPPDRAKDPVAVGRFRREVRALARCEHPNVVKIYASGEARGTHYYAMEFVDGADLRRVAKALSSSPDFDTAVSSAFESARGERSELFPGLPVVPRRPATAEREGDRWRQMARFFAQAARGLAHLHENGIVHRDLSPANVMVTWPDERAVIMDLGLASVADASVTLTKDKSAILGTLRYVAPEQLQRTLDAVDARADVYSFGATMYELFAGRPIFDGETEHRLIAQVLREDPRTLLQVEPRVPPEISHIVHKAVEKDPARRYAGAAQLAQDLEAFLAGEPISARAPTRGERLQRWIRRRRELVIGGAVGLLLAIAVTVIAVVRGRESAREQRFLQAATHMETLQKDWELLTGQMPEDVPRLESWVARSIEARDGSAQVAGLDELRAEIDRLLQRGTAMDAAAAELVVRLDPKLQRIDRLRQLVAWNASVLARRTGRPGPRFDESSVGIENASDDWHTMQQRAESLVGPRRNDDEQGMIGLALARRAMELVARVEPARISRVRATLAWALFTAGSDEEALTEIRRARAEAPEEERALVDVETLESAVTEARSPEQIRILERTVKILETSLRALEREVERRTTKAMRDEADLRRLESTVKLVGEIEALTEPDIGRLARTERWLDSARGMRERSIEGPAARAAWQTSLESIARDPRFAGLKLEPQLGLVPLGPDPASGLPEFAHVGTGSVPERRADGTLGLDAESALVLVLLPGGVTKVGAQREYDDDDHFDPNLSFLEDGIHNIRLDPYFVGKHELTLAQWMRIAGTNPNRHQPGRLRGEHFSTFRNPVESVSFNDAEAALRRVGLGLPTEAQLEHAGRAGTTTPWWTGPEARTIQDAANVCDAAYCDLQPGADCDPWNDGWATHAPVGSYRANAFGLHDTAGNVWEWCRDHSAPPDIAPRDGDGLRPSPPGVTYRIVRGGGWASPALLARSAMRDPSEPAYSGASLGVRAARAIEGPWSTQDGRGSSPAPR